VAELRESSLLFSLDALFAHERDKVERERRAAEERRQAAVAAEVAAEQARLIEQAHRAEAARERQLADERRFLDEQARLEAIRQAELERVRLEAKLKSEAELAARRARHELDLRALSESSRAKRLRRVFAGGALLCTVTVVYVAYAMSKGGPELERSRAVALAARDAETARAADLRRLLAEAEQRRGALERELAGHTHAPAPPITAPPATATVRKPGRGPRPAQHQGVKVSRPCTGDAHDPLNPCLGG
jgi:colicin import membrane protein